MSAQEASGVLKPEQFEAQKQVDATALATDLSHQLEALRAELEVAKASSREMRLAALRAEGARDALKELLTELWAKR